MRLARRSGRVTGLDQVAAVMTIAPDPRKNQYFMCKMLIMVFVGQLDLIIASTKLLVILPFEASAPPPMES